MMNVIQHALVSFVLSVAETPDSFIGCAATFFTGTCGPCPSTRWAS